MLSSSFLQGNDITKHATPLSLSAIAAAAAVTSILISRLMGKTSGYKEIPVAKGSVPYFGHLRSYLYTTIHDIPAILMAQRNKDMGPIVRYNMGSQPWLVISDAEIAHELLNTHGLVTSHRAKHTYGNVFDVAQYGVTFHDPVGSRWNRMRAALSQYVSTKQLGIHDDILHKEADYAVKRLLLSSNGPPTAVFDDVERYGHRLDELHRKLESSYNDLLSGPTEKTEEEENMLLEDGTFITGAFGEDLGDDYFGFKALGLDQEYNVEAFTIPPRLWFGGNKEKVPSKTMLNKEPQYKYPPAPPFTPVTSEKQMIGLLQPLFQKKLADAPNGRLTEDEYLPIRQRGRPRYPPTNKLLSGRKKPLKDAGSNNALTGTSAGGDTRKTKRKRPPEEIQAIKEEREKKRRQKMEERAQRAAEKEEKRKLREELKEQERLAKQEAKDKKAQAKKPNASGSSNS